MGGQAKDEESARRAAVEMGWVDNGFEAVIQRAAKQVVAEDRVGHVRTILDGRPWVCTEQEQEWLDDLMRGFELFRPRWVGGLP